MRYFQIIQEIDKRQRDFSRWFGKSKIVDVNGKPLIVFHGTRNVFDKLSESIQKLPIPATPKNIELAKKFVFKKWQERAKERGAEVSDLSSSCKFSSMFAQRIFGGKIRGNYEHQYLLLNGNIIDLNSDAEDVQRIALPYHHDKKFWNNKEHRKSLESCAPRVEKWVQEFINLVDM